MKVSEAIEQVKKQKPNAYDEEQLLQFLNEIERMVQSEVFKLKADEMVTYDFESNSENELLISMPYDIVYVSYILARVDFINQDYANYNNMIAIFNDQYDEYKRYYRRNNIPKQIYVTNIN